MSPSSRLLFPALLSGALAGPAAADMTHEWIASFPVGAALTAGIQGMAVDPAGTTYFTAINGTSGNTDVLTGAVASDGTVLWTDVFDGTAAWHDQARGIALAPGGVVWVCGNTPGPGSYADVLLLKYDRATGALLDTIQWTSGPFTSEHGASIAADAQGNVYVLGGTVGDGADAMLLKFDASGAFQWKQTWDGPAWGPYSQDHGLEVLVAPDGDPVAMIHGVTGTNHPDFVVVKYAAADGAQRWQATWGVYGEDAPVDMELDAAGDVFVTGVGFDFVDKFSTIKLRGSDGQLLWQEYDALYSRNYPRALALDGQGGVYVAGSTDPDGDQSNFNDDFYVVKRDAATGALGWSFTYGDPCVGCFDVPSDVVVDANGHCFVAGSTSSAPYSADVITFALDAASGLELTRGVLTGGPLDHAGTGSIALDGGGSLYNAGQTTNVNTGQKEVTVFKYPPLQVPWSNYCVGAPNSLGPGAVIGAAGSVSVADNAFTLTVSGAAADQLGLFYYGTSAFLFPFGDGWQCVGGATFRLNPPQATSAAGAASRPLDFTQPPAAAGPGAITGGSTWYFQFWYRDPAAGNTGFNLSDGLEVDFLP